MRCLGVEVGSDLVGAFKCVAAYLSKRISVGRSSNVRSKLHNAKTVRLAAIILLARQENILVALAFVAFVAARFRPGDLILSHGMPKANQGASATDRTNKTLS